MGVFRNYISNPAWGCGQDRANPDRGVQRLGLDAARSSPNPRAWPKNVAVPTRPCNLHCWLIWMFSTRRQTVVKTNVSPLGLHQRLARRWWSPKGETFVLTTVYLLVLNIVLSKLIWMLQESSGAHQETKRIDSRGFPSFSILSG